MRVKNRQLHRPLKLSEGGPTANRQPVWRNCLSLAFVFLISCTQNIDTSSGDLNGVYAGYYTQTGAVTSSAYVKLVFVGSNFSGEGSDSLRSICNGSYQIAFDSILFNNFCSTSSADLLLAGKYKIKQTGDSLYFSRDSLMNMLPNTELFSLKSQ
jgi:hypothetical protein